MLQEIHRTFGLREDPMCPEGSLNPDEIEQEELQATAERAQIQDGRFKLQQQLQILTIREQQSIQRQEYLAYKRKTAKGSGLRTVPEHHDTASPDMDSITDILLDSITQPNTARAKSAFHEMSGPGEAADSLEDTDDFEQ